MRVRFGVLLSCIAFAAFSPPAACSRPVFSLSGAWEFTTDPGGAGGAERWYAPDAAWPRVQAIQVPGCWEAQGVGGPGVSNPTTPEQATRRLRGSYVGTAWYRKRVEIPKAWKGCDVWLNVGGVNSQGWFWVNGEFVAHVDSYCGNSRYDITDHVQPGRQATIVARVRNDVPSRKGVFNWMHRFGGLYRDVELEATRDPFIESVYTVADATRGGVVWKVRLRSLHAPAAGKMTLTADFAGHAAGQAEASFEVVAGQVVELSVLMALAPLRYWSPETPSLYSGTAELLVHGERADSHPLRFGVKTWEVRDGDFYLNGRRYYLRGYGDDFVYPLTICSPADPMFHVKHFEIAKRFGFNYVRLHTHCELPEYFEAADQVGMMIQPELPYYGARPSAGSPEYFMPESDLRELVENYRDHVSLATFCTGNEGSLGSPTDEQVFRVGKGLDPTRLFLHQDGGVNRPGNSDYDTIFEWDPRLPSATFAPTRPLVLHEYLNLALDEDPRNAARYTGAVLPARTMDAFNADPEHERLDPDLALRCFDAGYRLQSFYQKQGLEKARRDPRLDGQIYWTIADVGAPYSSQGLLDQFWNLKGSTPEYFRQFNAPTVLLAEFPRNPPIFAAGETVNIVWSLSHFEETDARSARLAWMLGRGGGVVLGSGSPPPFALQVGVHEVARTQFVAPARERPEMLSVHGRVETLDATPLCVWENEWNVWIFPATKEVLISGVGVAAGEGLYGRLSPRMPGLQRADHSAQLLLSGRYGETERRALAEGRDVLLLALRGWPTVRPGVRLGWWTVGGQAGTAVANHAAFGDFPHDGWLSPVFFGLMDRAVRNSRIFAGAEPLMLGSGRDGYVLDLFQANAGKGRLLASGLDLLSGRPEADALLRSLIAYARGPRFVPTATLELDALPRMESFNGFERLEAAAERRASYDSWMGPGRLYLARQTNGKSVVSWTTEAVPSDLSGMGHYRFRFAAGMGFASQKKGNFSLRLNGQHVLRFDVALRTTTWKSLDGACQLRYEVRAADQEDSSGVMELTVPASRLTTGRPATLEVRGTFSGSPRWFGIYDF